MSLSRQQHDAKAKAYERAYDLIDEASELITNEAYFSDDECFHNADLLRVAKAIIFNSADTHRREAAEAELA